MAGSRGCVYPDLSTIQRLGIAVGWVLAVAVGLCVCFSPKGKFLQLGKNKNPCAHFVGRLLQGTYQLLGLVKRASQRTPPPPPQFCFWVSISVYTRSPLF